LNIGIIQGFVGGGGGIEKKFMVILEALAETKHKVTLYTFSKPNLSTNKIIVKSLLPFSIPAFGLYQRAMESKLVSKAKNEDIIIQASGGLSLPNNPNQKIIVFCTNDFKNELEYTDTKYRGIWSWYYKPYYQIIKKFFEKIQEPNIHLIANSKFVQESLKVRFNKDSILIHPPINLSEFGGKTSKKKKIITVSRFSREKNLEFTIEVMRGIEVNYTLIGNTKTKSNMFYFNNLLKKSKMPGSKIILLKNIPREEVLKNFSEAKIYFHPSAETFGITVMESIAAGCIPIVPDNSAHKETVPFSELRYSPDDIEDARSKVRKALSGEYDQFLSPLQSSLPQFSIPNFKKSFLEYLDKLL